MIGPNGAGKSSLVRALAGLVAGRGPRPARRRRPAAAPGPRARGRLVFQGQLLFPHLTALANVAFGPRARGVRRAEAEARAQDWLDRFGIGELADRKPRAALRRPGAAGRDRPGAGHPTPRCCCSTSR